MKIKIEIVRTKEPKFHNIIETTFGEMLKRPTWLEYAVQLSKLKVGEEVKDMRENGYIIFKRVE